MNELHLIDNFYLRVADRFSFVIIQKALTKTGKPIEKNCGYFGTVQSALKSVLDKAVRSSCEPLTAKTILKAIDNLNEKINGLKYEHITKLFKKEAE